MTSNPTSTRPTSPAQIISLDDRQLLQRHLGGDPLAFRELVSAYRSKVFGYLVRCGVRNESRDDLFQEIFLTIHSNASRYDNAQALSPWIFTIVSNKVRDHFRSVSRDRAESLGDREQRAEDPGAHELAEAAETADWLERAIRKLPLSQREVVLLCCVHNMEQLEAARALGMPINTLKTHLRRARITLARHLVSKDSAANREVSR